MELRYELDIEIRACMDLQKASGEEDDRDHLQEVEEILDTALELDEELLNQDICRQLHFDLCPQCHARFLRNPIGCEVIKDLTFSEN